MKLLRKKEVWCLTIYGWLLSLALATSLLFFVGSSLYPFLATNRPIETKVLVVEGWLGDDELPQVKEIFESGDYQKILITGGEISFAREMMPYSSYAEMSYHRLINAGFSEEQLDWVFSSVKRDRTFFSAVALRDFLDDEVESFNLISVGPHARRSHLLFEKAFNNDCTIGVISIKPQTFDAKNWWKCSDGVRTVINEFVAWLYASLVFNPEKVENGIEL